jgi:regulator of sigma E protease
MIFFIGYPTLTTKVGGLVDGYGAQSAGIIAGDKITAVDGKRVLYWDEVQKYIQAKDDASVIRLSVLRNDQELDIDVNIKAKQVNDILGQKHNVGLVGIRPDTDVVILRHGFWKSFSLGLNKTWELTELTYKALWRMVTGRLSFKESVTGPLGIFYITSEAAHIGFIDVMHLLAVLSISLAIFNLLPLPVLDGGHILLLAIEKVRGKALSMKAEQIVSNVGFTLIICLAVFATYNDIMRLFGDKISGFFK